MYKNILPLLILLSLSHILFAQQSVYTIEDAIKRAQEYSLASKSEETKKENRYWSYQYFKTNYNPQLRLQGTLPSYYKSVNAIIQPDGSYRYLYVQQMNNNIRLSLEQPIASTGGTISANTNLQYFKNYKDASALREQWSGSVLYVALDQPLFSFNALRWDRRIQPFLYEESKREYVQQKEYISMETISRFFSVLHEQINMEIATFNQANSDTIYQIEKGRYAIGTTSRDKLLQAELQVLRTKQDAARAKLNLSAAQLRLRSYIGLNDADKFPQLVLPENIPQLEVTVEDALQFARQNRTDFLSFQRRRLEADRDVAQARSNRFKSSVTAAYGRNNNGLVLSDVYTNPTEQQQINLTFSVPVLDWGRNKSLMKRALANKKLSDYAIKQEEITFEQSIITKVEQFETLALQIEISKKSDEVASERYSVAQSRYLIGKIDITNLNIALKEKDEAKRSYTEALRTFWVSFYELRMMTLYDFSKKELLYKPEE
jgi:outer membrane protein TolC